MTTEEMMDRTDELSNLKRIYLAGMISEKMYKVLFIGAIFRSNKPPIDGFFRDKP